MCFASSVPSSHHLTRECENNLRPYEIEFLTVVLLKTQFFVGSLCQWLSILLGLHGHVDEGITVPQDIGIYPVTQQHIPEDWSLQCRSCHKISIIKKQLLLYLYVFKCTQQKNFYFTISNNTHFLGNF